MVITSCTILTFVVGLSGMRDRTYTPATAKEVASPSISPTPNPVRPRLISTIKTSFGIPAARSCAKMLLMLDEDESGLPETKKKKKNGVKSLLMQKKLLMHEAKSFI